MSCSKCKQNSCQCHSGAYCSSPCHGDTVDFNCIQYNGNSLACIGLDKYDSGVDFVTSLNSTVCDLQSSKGKVYVDNSSTCVGTLVETIVPGANISLTVVGTGCSRQLRIDSTTGGVVPDINVKVTANDTSSSYLDNKILGGSRITKVVAPAVGNQTMTLDVSMPSMLSTDSGNQLSLGSDLGIFYNGVQRVRNCFDDTWRNLTLGAAPVGMGYLSGTPQYKIMYDGSIHFRGYAEYQVSFQAYKSSNLNWRYNFNIVNLFTNLGGCFSSGEVTQPVNQQRIVNSQFTPDVPASTSPAFSQFNTVTTTWVTNFLAVELMGSYESDTIKTVRISFEGMSISPNI